MKDTKIGLLGNLVRYINNLEKGNKTVVFMTALLISWEDMEVAQVEKICNDIRTASAIYSAWPLPGEEAQ